MGWSPGKSAAVAAVSLALMCAAGVWVGYCNATSDFAYAAVATLMACVPAFGLGVVAGTWRR